MRLLVRLLFNAFAPLLLYFPIMLLFLLFAVRFDLLFEIRNILFQHFAKRILTHGNFLDHEFGVNFPKRIPPFANEGSGDVLYSLGLFEIAEPLF